MPLSWNVEKTAAYAALLESGEESYEQDQRNVLDALIWTSLVVDMPGFATEEEADEFHKRMMFADALGHSAYTVLPSRERMQEWIGFQTNVSRKTWNQFVKRHVEMWANDHAVKMEVAR